MKPVVGVDQGVRALPKADLHVHLLGAVRAETFEQLAEAAGVVLPEPARELYRRVNSAPSESERDGGAWYTLEQVCEWIASCVTSADVLARLVYEALEDGLRWSNVHYQELAFSPWMHSWYGISYTELVDGLTAGLEAAEADFGVQGRLIAAIGRAGSPEAARELVETVVRHPSERVVGIGLDGYEGAGAPEAFVDAFALAARHGLRRTAHAGEHVPGPANVRTCLDLLAVDRIDHGYYILDDENLVRRCGDEGVYFNCAFTTSRRSWRPWRRKSILRMVQSGLAITLNSDDPALFPTTVDNEFAVAQHDLDLAPAALVDIVRNGFEAAFADDDTKRSLRARLESAIRESQ